MGAFKAYDFRGVFGKDFDLDTVYKFGFFLPSLLKTDKVLVGRDHSADVRSLVTRHHRRGCRCIRHGPDHHSDGLLLHRTAPF